MKRRFFRTLSSTFVFLLATWLAPAQAALLTGEIENLSESTQFTWGDGTNDLTTFWSIMNFGYSGWFYGSANDFTGMFPEDFIINTDVAVMYGMTDILLITDAGLFEYSSDSMYAEEQSTVLFKGTNGFFGAWVIEDISEANTINGRWYFLDDGSDDFSAAGTQNPSPVSEPSLFMLFLFATGLLLIRRYRR